ncbi:MAG: PadR family transcriptional regulator, partial [Bacteroidota bacterium]
MSKEHLGEFEELVLLMIVLLDDDAYGLAIRKALKEHVKRTVTIGAVHATINRLQKKGFIESCLGGASELRGGRKKRLLTITSEGKKMLEKSQEMKVSLWAKIPDLAIQN